MELLIIKGVCLVSLVLILWFRTDVWLEYCKLFHLDFISFYKYFEDKKKSDVSLTYIIYLRMYHNGFFVRLITCPICLSVWIGIICGLVSSILLIPVYIIGGLILFTTIDRLLG